MSRRLGPALLAAGALAIAACGAPDADRSSQPVSVVTVPTEVSSLSTATATASPEVSVSSTTGETPSAIESTTASSAASTTATTPPAEQLGAAAVVPWGLVTQEDIDRAVTVVASLSASAKAGAVVMASSADAVGSSLAGDLQLGGVILMGAKSVVDGTSNGTPGEVAEVTATLQSQVDQAGFPLLIGTDQEFGLVTRLANGFTELPSQAELGAIDDLDSAVDATQQAAAVAGAEMSAVGINVDFAPVSDVLPSDGDSEMAGRSYGSDPERVSALVTAAVAGFQTAGIAATLKHFPGIGELASDTHLTLATITADCDRWNAEAAPPIRAGSQAGVGLVMTGHALFPSVDSGSDPTSLSAAVVDQLLRGDPAGSIGDGCTPIGFRGVAVTDSLQMAPIANGYSAGDAAWRGLLAGQDLLLMPTDPAAAVAGIEQAVASSQLPEGRLNEAAVRVFALRAALGRTERPPLDTVGSSAHQAVADRVWSEVG